MKNTNCSNGLRAQIQFQSCWDGINLYKSDNSHVAYMSQIDNGVCPPGYPVQLVHLFYEVLYGTNNIHLDGGRFVFAQGDTTIRYMLVSHKRMDTNSDKDMAFMVIS